MPLRLLVRFHLVPFLRLVGDAVGRKPWFFAVALLILGVVALRPGGDLGALPTGLSEAQTGATGALLAALGTLAAWAPLRRTAVDRRVFFAARPGGASALAWWAFARLGTVWLGVSVLAGWFLGPPGWVAGAAWALSGPLVCTLLARAATRAPANPRPSPTRGPSAVRTPGVLAFSLSHPVLFVVPGVATLAVLAWAVAGGGGFVWADHPPVADLMADLLWPTLFGLVWADVNRVVPYRYFRMARAPFGRIAAVLAAPVAAQTLVVLLCVTAVSGSAGAAGRSWVVNLAATAFWFFFGLRWGPASILTVAVSWGLLVLALVADRDWWWAWALVMALGAAVGAAGWKAKVEEGTPGEEDDHG